MARLGDQSGGAAVQMVRGDAAWLGGQLPEAYTQYERAQQRYARLGLASYRARLLLLQAGVMRELGQLAPAAAHLAEASALGAESGMKGVETDARYERALQAIARRDWRAAETHLARFESETATNYPHYLYDIRMRRAEAYAGAERFDDAEQELESAAALLASWRSSIDDRSARLALLDSRRIDFDPDLGLALTVDRLARAGRVVPALHAAEDRRAQVLWQQMARRATLAGTGQGVADAENVSLADLPAALPDSTALLEYVTGHGAEPTTLFVVTRHGVQAHTLPTSDSLVASIGRLVALLPSGASADALTRRLGDFLLGPALAQLGAGISRVVVVPDGLLHRVPFDALLLPGGRAAIERFRISVAPSARIARRWWVGERRAGRSGVLAFADPAYDPAAGLARLAGSGAEGRDVAAVTGDARLLTREAASEAALKHADLRRLGVLHFATHARVQDWGLLASALYLAPGEGEDGRVGPEEIAGLSLDVDLVMLSGCRTVGGAIASGEGVQGLTAPFLEAGARAVAATYWEVGDRAMADLMARFYRELATGHSAGDALRLAKLAARRAGASPGVWAAMTLVGDADVRPVLGERTRRGG
jgi:tetratricopeptide (TPR) repeat protein